MITKLIAIGHVIENINSSGRFIGGGVTYSGIVFKKFGFDVEIITKIPSTSLYIDELKRSGIGVVLLPTNNLNTTTLTEEFDALGNRQETVKLKGESIILSDLEHIPFSNKNIFFLVAPVLDEISIDVVSYLAKFGPVAITAQGFLRKTTSEGLIVPNDWTGFEKELPSAAMVFLSEEDISGKGEINVDLLQRICSSVEIVIMTRGRKGANIYQKDKQSISIAPFPLHENETRVFTGAGDVFAAAYIAKFANTENHHTAGVFAAFVAAVKIVGLSGLGVESIPTHDQLKHFVKTHPQEVAEFLENNGSEEDVLII